MIGGGFVNAQRLYPEFGWQSPNLYTFPISNKARCNVKIDGIETSVEILAASEGFMVPSDQSSLYIYDRDRYLQFLNSDYLHNGDFAIIRDSRNRDSHRCKKGKLNNMDTNISVHYLGYPSFSTGRSEGRNSDGVSLLISKGFLVDSILSNSCLSDHENSAKLTLKYDS